MFWLLAQVKLDDVLRSTHESMQESPDSPRLLALVMGAAAVVIVLLVVHHRTRSQTAPRGLNHPGRLLKEVMKNAPLRANEVRQLKALAEQEGCSSPLVLLLCPSVLAKGIQQRPARSDTKALGRLARKVGLGAKSEAKPRGLITR